MRAKPRKLQTHQLRSDIMECAMQPAQFDAAVWIHHKLNLGPARSVFNRSDLANFSGSPQSTARLCAGVLAIFENLHAINKYVLHANRVLMWLLKRRAIGNRCRIEDDDIREHSFLEESAIIQSEIGCR